MIACLPMYDTISTRQANDALWALIHDTLGFGPTQLDRDRAPDEAWRDPTLVLSQTCGLPYRSALHGHVTLIGTPDYGVRGCPAGFYKSHVIVRKTDPRHGLADFGTATLARNDMRSQSGWAAIENHLKEHDLGFSFRARTLDTGSHAASAQAVRAGDADIAAIDAITWTLFKREHPGARDLRVLFSTRPTPGLPFIAALGADRKRLFNAIGQAITRLSTRNKARLLLKGIVAIPAETYLAEPLPAA